jgi:hypothetical protein
VFALVTWYQKINYSDYLEILSKIVNVETMPKNNGKMPREQRFFIYIGD